VVGKGVVLVDSAEAIGYTSNYKTNSGKKPLD
jgi:hypothetical protein